MGHSRVLTRLGIALLVLVVSSCAHGGTPAGPTRPVGGGNGAPRQQTGPRPYGEVVTAQARTDDGLFVVHAIADNVLFEIPDSLLGRDMLLITRIAGVPANMGGFLSAGTSINEQLVRFEREQDRILLRKYGTQSVAADSLPIHRSVIDNNFAPILASFEIEAFSRDSSAAVVDVTDFYKGDTPAISGLSPAQRRQYQVRRLDSARSFINWARSFPLNVNVRHTLTYDAGQPPSDEETSTISMEMN